MKPPPRKNDDVGSAAKDGYSGVAGSNPLEKEEFLNQFADRYPPTKIKIMQDLTLIQKHLTHPINRMMADYNEFTKLVFRTRVSEQKAL